MTRPWTDEEIAAIRRMWAGGHSAGAIALALDDRSRNSVIGKLHRMGGYKRSQHKPSITAREGRALIVKPPRIRKPRPVAKVFPQEMSIPAEGLVLHLFRTSAQCAAPMWSDEPGWFKAHVLDARSCGRPVAPGQVYCQAHCRIFYEPPKRRDRRADNGRNASRFIGETA